MAVRVRLFLIHKKRSTNCYEINYGKYASYTHLFIKKFKKYLQNHRNGLKQFKSDILQEKNHSKQQR